LTLLTLLVSALETIRNCIMGYISVLFTFLLTRYGRSENAT